VAKAERKERNGRYDDGSDAGRTRMFRNGNKTVTNGQQ
jgi:hypothetical protein